MCAAHAIGAIPGDAELDGDVDMRAPSVVSDLFVY